MNVFDRLVRGDVSDEDWKKNPYDSGYERWSIVITENITSVARMLKREVPRHIEVRGKIGEHWAGGIDYKILIFGHLKVHVMSPDVANEHEVYGGDNPIPLFSSEGGDLIEILK